MPNRWLSVRTEVGSGLGVGQLHLIPVARVVRVRLGGGRLPFGAAFAWTRPIALEISAAGQTRRLRVPYVRPWALAVLLVLVAGLMLLQRQNRPAGASEQAREGGRS